MTPVVLFARVSTSRQDNDRQLSDLNECAQRLGFEVVHTITEVMSGTKRRAERPALQELLATCRKRKVGKVLVTEISRLGRRTVEVLNVLDELTEAGISVYVQSYGIETLLAGGKKNPLASLLFTLLAEFAQMEKETQRERIVSGQAEARRKGVQIGRKFGSTKSDAEILTAYPKVVRLLRSGNSIRQIVDIAKVSDGTVQKVKRILTKGKTSDSAP